MIRRLVVLAVGVALLSSGGQGTGVARAGDAPSDCEAFLRSIASRVGQRSGWDRIAFECELPAAQTNYRNPGTRACFERLAEILGGMTFPSSGRPPEHFDAVLAYCVGGRDAPVRQASVQSESFSQCSRQLLQNEAQRGARGLFVQGVFFRCAEVSFQEAVVQRSEEVFGCLARLERWNQQHGTPGVDFGFQDRFCSREGNLGRLARPEVQACAESLLGLSLPKRFGRPLEVCVVSQLGLEGFSPIQFRSCLATFTRHLGGALGSGDENGWGRLREESRQDAVSVCLYPSFAAFVGSREFQACFAQKERALAPERDRESGAQASPSPSPSSGRASAAPIVDRTGDIEWIQSFIFRSCGSEGRRSCAQRLSELCLSPEDGARLCDEREQALLRGWFELTRLRWESILRGRRCSPSAPAAAPAPGGESCSH